MLADEAATARGDGSARENGLAVLAFNQLTAITAVATAATAATAASTAATEITASTAAAAVASTTTAVEIAASAAEAAASTTTKAPAASRCALFGFVHSQLSAIQLEHVTGGQHDIRCAVFQLNEGESLRAPGIAVDDHARGQHLAVLGKKVHDVLIGGGPREVSNKNLLHALPVFQTCAPPWCAFAYVAPASGCWQAR